FSLAGGFDCATAVAPNNKAAATEASRRLPEIFIASSPLQRQQAVLRGWRPELPTPRRPVPMGRISGRRRRLSRQIRTQGRVAGWRPSRLPSLTGALVPQ